MATLKRERIDVFSIKLVRRQDLPHGTELLLIKRDGTPKRRDTKVNRRSITKVSCPLLPDGASVNDLLEVVSKLLMTDLEQRGWKLRLVGPDSRKVNGGKSLGALRQMPPKPTQDELEQKEFDRELEAEIQDEMEDHLRAASRFVDDPARLVGRATLSAMVSQFGRDAARDAAEHVLRTRMR